MTLEGANAADAFESLLDFIKANRGFDFTGYKRSTLGRRIEKRAQIVGIADLNAYREYLEANPDEFAELFNNILINVTAFMRDPPAWDFVQADVVPRIVAAKDVSEPIRCWSAGCASGEEAYSLAMVLGEVLGEDELRNRVKIYATDIDIEALVQARHGRYPATKVESALPAGLVEKYFERENSNVVFRNDLRRTLIIGRHDLMQDPPISRIDLLVCRNTLMYFTAEAQRRILGSFHFALRDGGFLFLGKSEMLVNRSNQFAGHEMKARVFTKTRQAAAGVDHARLPGGAEYGNHLPRPPTPVQVLRDAAFDAAPVAQLVVAPDGTLMLASRLARALFNLTNREIGVPFKDLEVSYRPVELRSKIDDVRSERRGVTMRDVEVLRGGDVLHFDVELLPLKVGDGSGGISIAFREVTEFLRLQEDLQQSQRELETAYEELQSAVEELETTNEELQSTNEELETTNEELQSTNEELETMNEELQSANEELETINDDLRERTDEVNQANDFLQFVFRGLRSGVAVVTGDLTVRVWNHEAEDLWGLREDEVVGTHLLNLEIGLPVDALRPMIRACVAGEAEIGHEVLPATNRRGRPIECGITCTPLKGHDAAVVGAILLMDGDSSAPLHVQ